jgi:protein transport protein SEC24
MLVLLVSCFDVKQKSSAHLLFLLLVGVLPALTGGDTHYFPDFDKSRSGDLFAHDLRHSLEREQGSNGALRLRCSNGKLSPLSSIISSSLGY